MDERTNEANGLRREKVRVIPIELIDDFPDHPFLVKDDESMDQLIKSIQMNGVLNKKIIVTLKGGYQAEEELRKIEAA